jgi:hypothetical protein
VSSYKDDNGNFLTCVEMIGDMVVRSNFRRIRRTKIHHRYLSQKNQNELISLLATDITRYILKVV